MVTTGKVDGLPVSHWVICRVSGSSPSYLCSDTTHLYGTAWRRPQEVQDYALPRLIQEVTGQIRVPIGDGVVCTKDSVLGAEACEELWTPEAPHIAMSLDGVEIFSNGSGSHHTLRKLNRRIDLMRSAMSKCGGVYLYANQQGVSLLLSDWVLMRPRLIEYASTLLLFERVRWRSFILRW